MACSLSLVPLAQLRLLAGQEHGRTIPLAEVGLRGMVRLGVSNAGHPLAPSVKHSSEGRIGRLADR